MSNIKKLMMTAAGGADFLNVEDVFSTDAYLGNNGGIQVINGVSLSNFNNVMHENGYNGSRAAAYFKGQYYFYNGNNNTVSLSDPLGVPTVNTNVYSATHFAADSNYLYYNFQSDFYYWTGSGSSTQMATNPYSAGSVSVEDGGMLMSANGSLVVSHQNPFTGNPTVSVTSNLGATWSSYTQNFSFVAPMCLLTTGTLAGLTPQGQIKYNTDSGGLGSFSSGSTITGGVVITYLNSGVYIVGSANGYIYTGTSLTGTFTQQTQLSTTGVKGLVTDGTTAYAMTNEGTHASTNGTSWTKVSSAGIASGSGYTYPQCGLDATNGVIYVGGMAGTINLNADSNGGMVWVKNRDTAYSHTLADTEHGVFKQFTTNGTPETQSSSARITSFNHRGFSIGSDNAVNYANNKHAAFTWRKAPNFFDIVTWTGNGSGTSRTISHNLGSVPGMMMVKRTDTGATGDWYVYHRGITYDGAAPEDHFINLNNTYGAGNSPYGWNDTAPTATDFTVRTEISNVNNVPYVAYIFAHHDGTGTFGETGDQDIIACGNYTGNGSGTGPVINLGWEPQWLLIKQVNLGYQSWQLTNAMSDFRYPTINVGAWRIRPDSAAVESEGRAYGPNANGFEILDNHPDVNYNGAQYIYVAIRRPMGVPQSATDVFNIGLDSNIVNYEKMAGTYRADMVLSKQRNSTATSVLSTRLTGADLFPPATNNESVFYNSSYTNTWKDADGFLINKQFQSAGAAVFHSWKRAPNFFDVVAFTAGTSANRRLNHNLGVAPEMIWVKRRDGTRNWYVYHEGMDASPRNYKMHLNLNSGKSQTNDIWGTSDPTATDFGLNENDVVGVNGSNCIAYLFATLAGVSKVGSYTGDGTTGRTINCGFTSGARFILIKRVDASSNGEWHYWDSARGIVSGNDPWLTLTYGAEATSTDSVDPASSGFIVNQDVYTQINVSGGEYIYYAIA